MARKSFSRLQAQGGGAGCKGGALGRGVRERGRWRIRQCARKLPGRGHAPNGLPGIVLSQRAEPLLVLIHFAAARARGGGL